MKKFKLPLIASLVAIAITTTMDFSGLTMYSALILLPITLLFWYIFKLSRKEMGLVSGKWKHYLIAILYPFIVLIVTLSITRLTGNLSLGEISYNIILIQSTVGMIAVLLTEEGFFRGWLWGAFKHLRLNDSHALWITSIVFMLWHISAVTSGTEYGLPWHQVPVYLVNAILLGLNWGMMRAISGSVLVPTVSHAVWNALIYEFFGFGESSGASGIVDTIIWSPEVGLLGIVLNSMFYIFLLRYSRRQL